MRNSIVEGEPGIFPDPISRVFVAINRWVRRRAGKEADSPEDRQPSPASLPDEGSPPPLPASPPPSGDV